MNVDPRFAWRSTWSTLRVELRMVLRDPTVLASSVLTPILVYPAIIWGINQIIDLGTSTTIDTSPDIVVVASPRLQVALAAAQRTVFPPGEGKVGPKVEGRIEGDVEVVLADPDIEAVIVLVSPEFPSPSPSLLPAHSGEGFAHREGKAEDLAQPEASTPETELAATSRPSSDLLPFPIEATIHVKPGLATQDPTSLATQALVSELETMLADEQAKAHGLDPAVLQEPAIILRDSSPSKDGLARILGSILAFLLLMPAVASPPPAAADLFCGDDEGGTMETLAVTKAPRWSVTLGRFLALYTLCILTWFASALGLGVNVFHLKVLTEAALPGESSGPGWSPDWPLFGALGLAFGATLLVGTSLAAMLASIAKKRQTAAPLASGVMVLGMVAIFAANETDGPPPDWVPFLPYSSTAHLILRASEGNWDGGLVTQVSLVHILFAIPCLIGLFWAQGRRRQLQGSFSQPSHR